MALVQVKGSADAPSIEFTTRCVHIVSAEGWPVIDGVLTGNELQESVRVRPLVQE